MRIRDKITGRFITHSLEERFWEKVDKKSKKECWRWKGFLPSNGYGRLRVGKRHKMATAVSWYIEHGAWPTLYMCHKCDNPLCVNPNHLFEGTPLDNAQDKVLKGRAPRGSNSSSAKTDENTVLNLKKDLYTLTPRQVADKYNINYWSVIKIKNNKQWKHV